VGHSAQQVGLVNLKAANDKKNFGHAGRLGQSNFLRPPQNILFPNMPAASDIAFLKEAEKRATELISEARDGGWRENTPVRALLSTL
jgi:hypothetical protein